jgi:cysteine desulfurase
MTKRVYLDNSATTPVAPEVIEAMLPYMTAEYGNASSLHSFGREARTAVEESRATLAATLGAEPPEIVFTSGATEADNLAIMGLTLAAPGKKHIITTTIEHHAVLHTCQWLEKRGYEVTYLDVDASGRVDPAAVADAIRQDTLLVSVMAGNNEIGTIEPIDEIGSICKEHGVLFHTDAVQAYGKIALPIKNVDLLSVSAHKFNGPKGVGFLFIRRGIKLAPILHGGGHELGRRSGTENVPGIVGMATAARLTFEEMDETAARLRGYRERLIEAITAIPETRLNGGRTGCLPHIANFGFARIEGESLVMRLDEHEIAVSTGSACSSPNLEPSHVLVAIGVPLSMAHGSLRVSTGRQTTEAEIDTLIDVLPQVVSDLRAISPFKVGE